MRGVVDGFASAAEIAEMLTLSPPEPQPPAYSSIDSWRWETPAHLPLFASVCAAWAAEFALCAFLARRWRLDVRAPTPLQRALGLGAAVLGIACCFRGGAAPGDAGA